MSLALSNYKARHNGKKANGEQIYRSAKILVKQNYLGNLYLKGLVVIKLLVFVSTKKIPME